MGKTKATKDKVHETDKRIALKVGRYRTKPFVKTLGAISEVGDQPPLRVIGAAIVIAGLLSGRRNLALAGTRALAAHSVATIAKSAIKNRIDRTRPERWLNSGNYKAERGKSDDSALNSFPSGHTAGAVAMAAALGRDYPHLAAPANGVAAAIAGTQLPRGKHYLSDILLGAVIGKSAEWLVSKFFSSAEAAIPDGQSDSGNLARSFNSATDLPASDESGQVM